MSVMLSKEAVKEVTNYWGEKTPMMCMEELAELIQAISKMERKGDVDHLKEEIRDVYISLSMLMEYYDLKELDIEIAIFEKLNMKKDK